METAARIGCGFGALWPLFLCERILDPVDPQTDSLWSRLGKTK
jgi:hypothetical protein